MIGNYWYFLGVSRVIISCNPIFCFPFLAYDHINNPLEILIKNH